MTLTLIIVTALLLDAWLGEPRRYHPLVGFGNWAQAVERHIYVDSKKNGFFAILLLVMPWVLLAIATNNLLGHSVIDILVLYLAIGWHSLNVHAKNVKNALLADDLTTARVQVGLLVSRDTTGLDQIEVTKGTIESILENGNDAIFGVIFWFVVAGAPGAIAYRLINTLDAMWGYRNDRYNQFGWAAARLDDCFNYIPARLTAISYALMGSARSAFSCWHKQGTVWKSPNAGPVMAAGAGSLDLSLGGPALYHGKQEQRMLLGTTRIPEISDIDLALRLIKRTLLFWVVMISIGAWFVEYLAAV